MKASSPETHRLLSPCCSPTTMPESDRRRFLYLALSGLAAATVIPGRAAATSGSYDAMVLSCIDPRFQKPLVDYLEARGLAGRYSQVSIAGAGIGAIAPSFDDWHQTFWNNLSISISLHNISRLIVVQHRDCGAARVAYGEFETDSAAEKKLHQVVIRHLQDRAVRLHPLLNVEAVLMDRQGTVEPLPA